MIDEEKYQALLVTAKNLLDRGDTEEEVKASLDEQCDDILLITVVMTDAKKIHFESRRKDGFTKIIAGAVLVVAGFLITMISFSGKNFEYALFGFTSAGIILVFWGMVRIIG